MKKILDGCGLFPKTLLARRRSISSLRGGKFLFSIDDMKGAETQRTSSEVTRILKGILRKVRLNKRITAHSGRKGGAVEALLVGVPIMVIQAWGLWGSVDTLLSYLGKAVCENCGVLEISEGRGNS